MRTALVLCALLALGACRDEVAALPDPVPLTAEAVGHFCQMHLLEHEGPKGQVHLDGMPAPLFFSQVRDAVAYLRLPEQSHMIRALYVNDMGAPGASWAQPGATNWIAATDAHYVAGSARIGGMGAPELVPFADRARAEDFARTHGGRVTTLDGITDDEVLAPVETGDTGEEADFLARITAAARDREVQP